MKSSSWILVDVANTYFSKTASRNLGWSTSRTTRKSILSLLKWASSGKLMAYVSVPTDKKFTPPTVGRTKWLWSEESAREKSSLEMKWVHWEFSIILVLRKELANCTAVVTQHIWTSSRTSRSTQRSPTQSAHLYMIDHSFCGKSTDLKIPRLDCVTESFYIHFCLQIWKYIFIFISVHFVTIYRVYVK